MDWFPYDIGLCHERVKTYQKIHLKNHTRKSQCSYLLVQSQQWKQQNKVWNLFKVNNKDTRTTSMTKGCFHYWLWPSKCRLGTSKSKSLMENFAYLTGWKDFVLAVFFCSVVFVIRIEYGDLQGESILDAWKYVPEKLRRQDGHFLPAGEYSYNNWNWSFKFKLINSYNMV